MATLAKVDLTLSQLRRHCLRYRIAHRIINQLKTIDMTINMGKADRIVRPLLAIAFIALYFTGTVTGTLGIALLVLAGIFLLTSAVGTCLIYSLLGIQTCPVKD